MTRVVGRGLVCCRWLDHWGCLCLYRILLLWNHGTTRAMMSHNCWEITLELRRRMTQYLKNIKHWTLCETNFNNFGSSNYFAQLNHNNCFAIIPKPFVQFFHSNLQNKLETFENESLGYQSQVPPIGQLVQLKDLFSKMCIVSIFRKGLNSIFNLLSNFQCQDQFK